MLVPAFVAEKFTLQCRVPDKKKRAASRERPPEYFRLKTLDDDRHDLEARRLDDHDLIIDQDEVITTPRRID